MLIYNKNSVINEIPSATVWGWQGNEIRGETDWREQNYTGKETSFASQKKLEIGQGNKDFERKKKIWFLIFMHFLFFTDWIP